jgi:predicted nuclease of predicted toxin-antitoxin system
MIFLADENLDFPIINALRNEGYDVLSISELSPAINDNDVMKIANSENRILLTSDKDFGELVFRLKLISSGIVLFRIPELSNKEKATLAVKCVKEFETELKESFSVVTQNKIRIIKLNEILK